jgi:hypothetical protein
MNTVTDFVIQEAEIRLIKEQDRLNEVRDQIEDAQDREAARLEYERELLDRKEAENLARAEDRLSEIKLQQIGIEQQMTDLDVAKIMRKSGSMIEGSVVGGGGGSVVGPRSVVETRSVVRSVSRGPLPIEDGSRSPGRGLRGRMPLRGNPSPSASGGPSRPRSRANSITTTTTTTRKILPEGGLKVSFSQNRQVTRRPMGRPGMGRGLGRPLGPPRGERERAMIPMTRPNPQDREVVTRLGPLGVQDPLVRPPSDAGIRRPLSRGPMPPPMRRGPLPPPIRGQTGGGRYSKMTTTTTTTMTESGDNTRPIL